MSSNIENEILQLISTTWLNSPNDELSKNYITRHWSIDTQWMSYNQAEALINEMIEKEWLIEDNSILKPNIKINFESISFGWKPKENIHNKLPKNNNEGGFETIQELKKKDVKEIKSPSIIELTSPQRRLVRYISANTGILKDEITRRCARKKRSLGQITTNLCLLLIAKEQGMDMQELLEGIEF